MNCKFPAELVASVTGSWQAREAAQLSPDLSKTAAPPTFLLRTHKTEIIPTLK